MLLIEWLTHRGAAGEKPTLLFGSGSGSFDEKQKKINPSIKKEKYYQ